jgi:hypothetical protein
MRFDLEHDGDALERAHAQWIRERIPAYAEIWTEFIGNDGKCQLPLQDQLPADVAKKRLAVAHRNYTALESVLGAKRIVEQSWGVVIPPLLTPESVTIYLDAINAFVGFFAHMGRIHDQVRDLEGTFKAFGLADPLHEFYRQRNVILHEAKVPAAIINGVLAIEAPAGTEHDLLPDRRASSASGVVELPIVLEHLLNELLLRLNTVFARLRAEYLYPQCREVVTELRSFTPAIDSLAMTTATPIIMTGFEVAHDAIQLIPSGTNIIRE